MKFAARVVSPDGEALKKAKVEIVSLERDGTVAAIGKGTVADGVLSASADPGALWGVRIDQRAVVTFPVSSEGELVNLGEIVMIADGLEWPAFHATDGRVYGMPRAAHVRDTVPAPGPSPTPTPTPGPEPIPKLRSKMTFGDVFGSTARQLSSAAAMTSANFSISNATVTLKGVPTATDDAISLEFPTAEVAASGIGLSELSFSIRPRGEAAPSTPPAPAGSAVPDLTGYTREFAVRKAAAAGFLTEINNEIVDDSAKAGSVIRQVPAPRAALTAGGLIRLYIGKKGDS